MYSKIFMHKLKLYVEILQSISDELVYVLQKPVLSTPLKSVCVCIRGFEPSALSDRAERHAL